MAAESAMRLDGLDAVLRNLNGEITRIKGRSLKGLIRGAIVVRRDMDKVSPTIPVDTGNLRSSYFVVTSKGATEEGLTATFKGEKAGAMVTDHNVSINENKSMIRGKEPALVMGFSAFYAAFVHENIGVFFRRPGAGAKYLQSALYRNIKNILRIIAREAKIR